MADPFAELIDAASRNDLATVKSLIGEKKIIPLRNRLWKAVHVAVEKGNLDVIQYIIERDPATVEQKNEFGETMAHIAAKNGRLDVIQCIAREKPFAIEKKSRAGDTIAHIAAKNGHLDIIQYVAEENQGLLAKKDAEGRTILHAGVEFNVLDTETFKQIDQKGISLLTVSKRGDTVASLAAKVGNLEILQYIIRRKPSTLKAMENGETVAHVAAQYGRLNVIRYMASKSPSTLEIKNKAGLTVAHIAAKYGHLDIIQCIAEMVPSLLETYAESIAELACNNGHLDVLVFMLENYPSLLTQEGSDGHTVLHRAVAKNLTDVRTLKFFIEEKGVSLAKANKENETIADFAARNGNLDIMRYVREREPSLVHMKERRRRSVSPPSPVVPELAEGELIGVVSRQLNNSDEMKTKVPVGSEYYPQLTSFLVIAALVFRPLSRIRPIFLSPMEARYADINETAIEVIETFQYFEDK